MSDIVKVLEESMGTFSKVVVLSNGLLLAVGKVKYVKDRRLTKPLITVFDENLKVLISNIASTWKRMEIVDVLVVDSGRILVVTNQCKTPDHHQEGVLI